MTVGLVWLVAVGCSDPETDNEPALDPDGPGWRIGAPGTPPVDAEFVWEPRGNLEVPDLAFDPMHDNRVWVMLRPRFRQATENSSANPVQDAGCDAMPSRTATIDNPGHARTK